MLLGCANALFLNDSEDVVLADDKEILAIQLHFGAAVFRDQNNITFLDGEGDGFAIFVLATSADFEHFSLLGFLLGIVRENDATGALFLGLKALDEHALAHGFDFLCHRSVLRGIYGLYVWGGGGRAEKVKLVKSENRVGRASQK